MSEKGITTITLKKINKSKVYQYIYWKRLTSKLQIVQDLKMGLSTVSQNLAALEAEGLIERNGYFDSTGGRKAYALQIAASLKLSIGIGILKNMFHITAVNLYGEAISMETFLLPYEDTAFYYEQVTEKIKEFIEIHKYQESQILGVSIASQGIISPDGSTVTYGAIMNNTHMNLSAFSARLPFPCRLEHDSKAAAYLELWNHDNLDSAVVFLLNRNMGGAIITNNTVHQGISMHSGTIEHLCIDPHGPLCYCKNHGCLETYCSVNALEEAAGVGLDDFFQVLRASTGKNKYGKIWHTYLNHLAFAMKNLTMVIDSPIILSGYLAPYLAEEDIEYLLGEINSSTPFSMAREHIMLGTHGQYTPAIGAALYYIEQFIKSR